MHYYRRLSYGSIYLEEQGLVAVAGRPIDVGYNSSPCIADWNSDGLPDLLVGNLSPLPAGVFLYLNQGTPFDPVYLQTDTVFCLGGVIELSSAYPDMYDMNFDGLEDLTVGSSEGRIACYLNSGTPQQPDFQQLEHLRADGEEINIMSYIRPVVCDWNSDGVPDILAGDSDGLTHLFTGIPPSGIETGSGLDTGLLSNPASGSVAFFVSLPEPSDVSASLYSLDGRLRASCAPGVPGEGVSELSLDVSGLPAGVYMLSVAACGETAVHRVVITK